MLNDLRGKAVLVTGGTAGIGLATGLAFGRQGAHCTLTYRWGSADEEDIRRQFAAAGAPEPDIIQADAANSEDTDALLAHIHGRHDHVEVLVSNVAFGLVVGGLQDYSLRALFQTIEYSTWPFVEYTKRIQAAFGRYPRYVIGLSSAGHYHYHKGYDLIAAAKSVLETLCRYMNYHLFEEDIRVNIVRPQMVRTDSLRATFGPEYEQFASRFNMASRWITPEEVADTIVGLCSGLLDGVSGQVIDVDRGVTFSDNLMRLFEERDRLEISVPGRQP